VPYIALPSVLFLKINMDMIAKALIAKSNSDS
jgi:hypothetical protein